jgi:GGDEF domain-containing protein
LRADLADGLSITASIGIASFGIDGETADALLATADAALYRAKAAGGDAVATSDGITTMTTAAV